MSSFIGIDLGTSLSAVAVIDDTGRPVILHNADGGNLTPSCVAEHDGTIVVGDAARRTWGSTPAAAAARFKRDMGTSTTHAVNGREFTPTELSSFVLKKLAKDIATQLGPVAEVVITIPANFSNEARDATMAAATQAGLHVRYIINEPTAAALYYAFKSNQALGGVYAVYDLGGGTFDVSIIRVEGQDIHVLASNGVAKLGGDDFDAALVSLVAKKYKAATGEDMHPDDYSRQDAEEDKKSLSQRDRVVVKVMRQTVEVTRAEFEEAISSRVTQAEMLCEATLDEAGLSPSDVRSVFLAGGSTRLPLVHKSVTRVFGQEPNASVNVDEVVALGAALYAGYKGDRSKLSTAQQSAIAKIRVEECANKCFGTLARGFDDARQARELQNTVLIRKGERLPCSVTQSFYTVYDGQDSVNCTLTESTAEEVDPRFVRIVWEGTLDLPPDRPQGQEISVTFAYDANQLMKCSFVDVATGQQTFVELSAASPHDGSASVIDQFMVE
jgi:molecular chaperone DnaK